MKSMLIIAVFLCCFTAGDAQQKQFILAKKDDSVTLEKNKSVVRSIYTELINKRNLSALDDFFYPAVVDHNALEGQEQGIAGFRKVLIDFYSAFEQLEIKLDDMIAGGDMVATHETWTATQATNKKKVTGKTMHIFRLVDGKVTDEWSKGWEWLEQ